MLLENGSICVVGADQGHASSRTQSTWVTITVVEAGTDKEM
ncbi:MAG: hypothetical protein ACLTW9_03770 [Enterocloster sp.]